MYKCLNIFLYINSAQGQDKVSTHHGHIDCDDPHETEIQKACRPLHVTEATVKPFVRWELIVLELELQSARSEKKRIKL